MLGDDESGGERTTTLCAIYMLKSIVLPRQAPDKYTENSKQERRFLRRVFECVVVTQCV